MKIPTKLFQTFQHNKENFSNSQTKRDFFQRNTKPNLFFFFLRFAALKALKLRKMIARKQLQQTQIVTFVNGIQMRIKTVFVAIVCLNKLS